ncbi:CcdC family protein [Melghirimyces algeriensis]|nr:cytochrome c biogenesis protein CcdC [Melghirimyces algeriensis]
MIVIFIRLRSVRKPTNTKKIIMPPIGMSTGFFMFIFPVFRIPLSWGITAFITGTLLFSWPLIKTSQFEVIDGKIYLKRSKAFIWILLLLLFIRMFAHEYVEQLISLEQTASLFFVLAFGMLLPWRTAMYIRYKQLKKQGTVATE